MFPISSSLLDMDCQGKDHKPREPINWQLHSSSTEMSVEDSTNHEAGNEELAALELSPISPTPGSSYRINVSSFSDINVAGENSASSAKSDSPGLESGKEYSSISSFSTLTSASKLPTEDIDFINFYFENNRRLTQHEGTSVYEIPVQIAARSRFLDCSPIPKLNFDETLVNVPSPNTDCRHIGKSSASAESVLEEELYEAVHKNTGGYMDESVADASSSFKPSAFLLAPVNSPDTATEMRSIPSSSKFWNCPPAAMGILPTGSSSQGVTGISPNSAVQKWKFDSRPPCVGQECSPESELNFSGTWRAIRNVADQCLCPNTTDRVDSDIDLTELNPPSPVLKNSARKVGSWLQHLQEGEYSEDPAVETSFANKASTLQTIECLCNFDKCNCGAYDDYMRASKMPVGGFQDASITAGPGKSTVPTSSVASCCETTSAVAGKQWIDRGSQIAVDVPPIASHHHQKVRRHRRKSRRSDVVKRRELNLVTEKALQIVETDCNCKNRTTQAHESVTSNYCVKHDHSRNNDCRKNDLSSDDNTLCNSVEDPHNRKSMTKTPSSTVFFVGPTFNPPRPAFRKPLLSSKHVLAKKLKAISLYIHHKKTYSHMNFKTLAIV